MSKRKSFRPVKPSPESKKPVPLELKALFVLITAVVLTTIMHGTGAIDLTSLTRPESKIADKGPLTDNLLNMMLRTDPETLAVMLESRLLEFKTESGDILTIDISDLDNSAVTAFIEAIYLLDRAGGLDPELTSYTFDSTRSGEIGTLMSTYIRPEPKEIIYVPNLEGTMVDYYAVYVFLHELIHANQLKAGNIDARYAEGWASAYAITIIFEWVSELQGAGDKIDLMNMPMSLWAMNHNNDSYDARSMTMHALVLRTLKQNGQGDPFTLSSDTASYTTTQYDWEVVMNKYRQLHFGEQGSDLGFRERLAAGLGIDPSQTDQLLSVIEEVLVNKEATQVEIENILTSFADGHTSFQQVVDYINMLKENKQSEYSPRQYNVVNKTQSPLPLVYSPKVKELLATNKRQY